MNVQDKERDQAQRDIRAEILRYLKSDKRVAWAAGVHVRAFRGCSDILGQLETGHFMAVKVKHLGEPLGAGHAAFLDQVGTAGGLGILAHGIEDVRQALDAFKGQMEPVSEDGLMSFEPETVLLMSEVSINPRRYGYRSG